ncbi:hypothetical protein B0T10DRAFT_612002 [Thelonectria olida]|uniref:Kelch repeat-containing protein n=1 Tax=Thelonectria olida TaxID=1576542 RepID=A0A9P8VNT5_9HYPO|nr:hypothetical protein B0T10DRAFT_612002 [Thelonectria olida]
MPQIHGGLSKNASVPSVHGGALWADDVNYRLFLFGGEFYSDNPTTLSVMSYDIWYDQWDDFGPPPAGIQPVSYGASTSVMERGEGYYYGGYLSNASVLGWSGYRRATSDLVRYKMDGNSWTKLAGPDHIKRAEGVMTFIPASDSGMLVYFGGAQDRNGTLIPQPMEQIFVYDIISNKWHVQEANGTIPEHRRRFCAGAVWSKDRSSYNIYLNAGLGFGGYGFDDAYVLSLPSFTWIKIYPLDRNGTGEYPSHSLSCNIVNEGSQMLTIGGSFPKDNTCDYEQVWGVHNIDLGNQIKDNFQKVWAEYIPTLVGYKVPEVVTSVIGGTKDGGATKMTPDAGFANHDISILLGMKAAFPTRTRANDGRTGRATAAVIESPGSKSGLSRSAIIGIAVGGGVVLLSLLVGLWLLIRKRKRKPNAKSVAPTEPLIPRPHTPPSFSPYHYTQSPESGQRMSPRSWVGDGGILNHNQVWRSSPANSRLSEMEGQGLRIAELGVGN